VVEFGHLRKKEGIVGELRAEQGQFLARLGFVFVAKIVEGQQDPVQGWLPSAISSVHPAPVGIYSAKGATTHILYVLAPSPKGAPGAIKSVEPLGGDSCAARITLAGGRVYEVRFHEGKEPDWKQVR